ncbi:hypothetical protein M3Y94_00091600 [Aphelenchoides besseyi]|nr:hypothetical protein M3Y94_00091600 [Aphelenchoides besseyi]
MFVAVDSSLLLSDEKKPGCLSGRKFEGACKDLNVDVTSKSGTIKATMSVKEGDKDFDGSISVGSCNIDGKFLGLKGFQAKEISSSFASPIKIVATATEVTLQGTQAPIQACKSAPFELEEDKSVKTNVKLHVDTGNIVSLQLDPSVDVGNEHHEEPGFWTRTWNSMPPWLWIIIFIICFVLLGLIVTGIVFAILRFCCCCKKPEKADLKASNANLENGNKQMVAHAKVPNGPKDKLPNADKKPEADVKGEKKDNEAVKKDNEAVKKDEKGPEVKPKDEKKVAVAPNPSNVNAAAPNPSNVNAAAPNPSNVNAAAPNPSNVNAAAPNPSNVNAAAPNPSNVNAAAPNPSNVNVAVTPKKSKEKKSVRCS